MADYCFGCLSPVEPVPSESGRVYHVDYITNHKRVMSDPNRGYAYAMSGASNAFGYNTLDCEFGRPSHVASGAAYDPTVRFRGGCVAFTHEMRPFLMTLSYQHKYWMPSWMTMEQASRYSTDKLFLDFIFFVTRMHPAKTPSIKTFRKFVKRANKVYPSHYDEEDYYDDVEE